MHEKWVHSDLNSFDIKWWFKVIFFHSTFVDIENFRISHYLQPPCNLSSALVFIKALVIIRLDLDVMTYPDPDYNPGWFV